MPRETPDSPGGLPPGGGIAGLLSQLFAYLDRPWKAVVVASLLVVGGVGYVLYEQRAELLEAWLTPSETLLKVADVPDALVTLVEESGADLVQVWSVDLSINVQRFVGARRRDGDRPVIPEPRRLPIIVSTSDVKSLLHVIEGSPICIPTDVHGSPLSRRLAERGMTWGCAMPIPPGAFAFVGVIYLSWVTRPEESQQVVAVTAAREIAGKLITR